MRGEDRYADPVIDDGGDGAFVECTFVGDGPLPDRRLIGRRIGQRDIGALVAVLVWVVFRRDHGDALPDGLVDGVGEALRRHDVRPPERQCQRTFV